jgi:dTDP-4-amino-4,6-dideoxygalactose transaminase
LLVTNNGTVALQIALKALGVKGEVITTPFSYVATTSSIVWENCKPVFVDIDKETMNIDPNLIEAAISRKTTAILATHCFGNSCDIDAIQQLADKYNLKVIYDAAHCFGTKYKGRSVLEYGDVSTLSLHATKLIHCVEGGAVVTKDPNLLKIMAYMRNFGHDGPEKFQGVGINGKNSELHAAFGLTTLKYADSILSERIRQKEFYKTALIDLMVDLQVTTKNCEENASYFPIVFSDETKLIKAIHQLNLNNVFPRRYFYPLLSKLEYVHSVDVPVAERIASSVLCLPMYHDLSQEEQDFIARILLRAQNYI